MRKHVEMCIYNCSTMEIIRNVSVPEYCKHLQVGEGEDAIEGHYEADAYKIDSVSKLPIERIKSIDELQDEAIMSIKNNYKYIHLSRYISVIGFDVNTGVDAANSLEAGIDYVEQNNLPVVNFRDFHNHTTAISVADARVINAAQFTDIELLRSATARAKDLVLAANTTEQINLVLEELNEVYKKA